MQPHLKPKPRPVGRAPWPFPARLPDQGHAPHPRPVRTPPPGPDAPAAPFLEAAWPGSH
jgi:hypothetical protein